MSSNAYHRMQRATLMDVALVCGLAVVGITPHLVLGAGAQIGPRAAVTSVLMLAPLLWRRTRPLLTMSLVFVAGVLQAVLVPAPTLSIIAVPIVAYSVARFVPGPRSRSVLVLGAIGSVLAPVSWMGPGLATWQFSNWLTSVVLLSGVCMTLVVTPYGVGRRVRDAALNRAAAERAEQERMALMLAEREQAARMAEVRARNQIARELHDIVAHSLSVMIVQAEGGKALAGKRPEAAAEVLGTLAETGREALTEMRRLVGVLRGEPGTEPVDYAPSPGLAEIPALVARSGDRVDLTVTGQLPPVPQTLGLTAFRIVQEAVTNFLKHAGPDAAAHVTVRYTATTIDIDVVDDGVGAAAVGDGHGNGLKGMRERVTSMGGRIEAGPLAGGGYRVHARLPVGPPNGSPDWQTALDPPTEPAEPQ